MTLNAQKDSNSFWACTITHKCLVATTKCVESSMRLAAQVVAILYAIHTLIHSILIARARFMQYIDIEKDEISRIDTIVLIRVLSLFRASLAHRRCFYCGFSCSTQGARLEVYLLYWCI